MTDMHEQPRVLDMSFPFPAKAAAQVTWEVLKKTVAGRLQTAAADGQCFVDYYLDPYWTEPVITLLASSGYVVRDMSDDTIGKLRVSWQP